MVRVAVVGAGIGGLATAVLLAQDGHDVTVFERFTQARAVGSGLVIQPVGLAVLDRIGVGDAARAYGAPVRRMLGHDGGREVLHVTYRADAPGLAMHRGSLFDVLWQAVLRADVQVVTGADVAAVPFVGGRLVQLVTGEDHGPFDLVVDAGGAGSPLSPLAARGLPFGAVWGHVPWPLGTALPQDELRQRYAGASRMAGVLPIGCLPKDATPRAAVFWSLPVAQLDGWAAGDITVWKDQAVALWPEIAPFLATITAADQMTVARYAHGTLHTPYAQSLVHIGDAAHRASPQLGQGANMALLDAYALSVALRQDDPLPAYARMRRWHVRVYQGMSWAFTPMYQSHSRMLPVLRNRVLAPASRLWPVRAVLTRLVSGDMIAPVAGVAFP